MSGRLHESHPGGKSEGQVSVRTGADRYRNVQVAPYVPGAGQTLDESPMQHPAKPEITMTASEMKTKSADLVWGVEAALAWHDEDPRATITLLLDCKHLREQLALAEQFMSRGLTRGRSPQYHGPKD